MSLVRRFQTFPASPGTEAILASSISRVQMAACGAHRGSCPFGTLHLILEDVLLPVASWAAANKPNTNRIGRSDHTRRTEEDIG